MADDLRARRYTVCSAGIDRSWVRAGRGGPKVHPAFGKLWALSDTHDATWPPSAALRAWRPAAHELVEALPVAALRRGGELPEWLELPEAAPGVDPDTIELPSCTLVTIELRSTLSDVLAVSALAHSEGGYRIVVTDEYETAFVPPITHTREPLTLGELLDVLDGTAREVTKTTRGLDSSSVTTTTWAMAGPRSPIS